MRSFCFVHAADLHLDTPFRGLRLSPAVREALRDASLTAWDALVELTLARRAAFLLLAGDIYDGPERGVRAQLRFVRGLERLDASGIPTFIVHGNHDPMGGWSAIRAWPPGVTIFGPTDVGKVSLPGVTVHGVSYHRRDVVENLALRFQRGPEPGLHIALLHANVGNVGDHAAYSPCTVDDLTRTGMDYWALGHVHVHAILRRGNPWIVYPGCLQGRSIHAGEQGAKGAVVVDVDDGQIRGVEFVPLDAMRFASFEVDIAAIEDMNVLRGALLAGAEELRSTNAGRGLLLKATVTGRGPLHADLRRDGGLNGLLAELREEHHDIARLLWWDGLTDETRPEIDLAAIRSRGDFASELLDVADEIASQPARRKALWATRFKALDAAHIPRDYLDEEDDETLFDRAVRTALDYLDEASDES